MMEMTYTEFKHVVIKTKQLPVQYSVDLVDENRYYHLQASEFVGANVYFCTFNSNDDSNDTLDFEQNYLGDCNKPINIPGMSLEVQAKMLHYLGKIAEALDLLNERFEDAAETGISEDEVTEY